MQLAGRPRDHRPGRLARAARRVAGVGAERDRACARRERRLPYTPERVALLTWRRRRGLRRALAHRLHLVRPRHRAPGAARRRAASPAAGPLSTSTPLRAAAARARAPRLPIRPGRPARSPRIAPGSSRRGRCGAARARSNAGQDALALAGQGRRRRRAPEGRRAARPQPAHVDPLFELLRRRAAGRATRRGARGARAGRAAAAENATTWLRLAQFELTSSTGRGRPRRAPARALPRPAVAVRAERLRPGEPAAALRSHVPAGCAVLRA